MEQDYNDQEGGNTPAEREPVFYLDRTASSGGAIEGSGRGGWHDDEPGLDWRKLFQGLWRRKWLVLAATLAGIAGGVYLYQGSEPVYQTRATIWLEPTNEESGPIRPAEIFEGQGWADILSSQAVLQPVVEEERLFVRILRGAGTTRLEGLEVTDALVPGQYRFERLSNGRFELRRVAGGGFGLGSLLDEILGSSSTRDSLVQQGRLGEVPVGQPVGFRWSPDSVVEKSLGTISFRVERPTDTVERLRTSLLVGYSADAGNLINTQFRWSSPDRAMELHNAILDSFLEVAQRLKSQKQKEVVGILERQTEFAAARLDSAELALRNFRVGTITLPDEPRTTSVPGTESSSSGGGAAGQNPVFGTFFEQRLTRDQLQSQLEDLRNVLSRLEETGSLDVLALRMNAAVDRSPQLQQALSELMQMEGERRSMLSQYTEEYPPVQELGARIQAQRKEVIPELVRELVEQLERRIQQLDQRIASRASELREIPKRSIQEERLRREVEMAEQLHSNLLTRLKEAELSARTSLPDLQVVDRATPPGGPSENPGPRLFMIASVAGVGLGVGGSLLLDRFDSRIRYPDDVTDEIGIRILGVVPRVPTRGARANSEREQETVEAFRAIRGQLSRISRGHNAVYLVTSPSPREGKTLIGSNLGISFANSGSRTLVVDCDTRRGNLHDVFDRSSRPGLAEVLTREAQLEDVVVATDTPGLFLVPRGNVRGFNTELLDSERMDDFVRGVRERYDNILLDAPPLHAGADSLFLGERSDQVVVVLRTGQTDREEARARLNGIGSFDVPLVGAIMNDVPASDRYYRYYYYSSYGPDQIEGEVVSA